MLRGDEAGRVPFALVAVLLLMSAGMSALYAAKLAGDEADRRATEAQLDALARVADLVHEEVEAQAQQVALRAIQEGTDGVVNGSRIGAAFRSGFADYIASTFPRAVRTVAVRVPDFRGEIHLVERETEDLVPSNATRTERIGGTDVLAVNASAPDSWSEVDRLAYYGVSGFVSYTVTMEDVILVRSLSLRTVAPAPIPWMAGKLEQAEHMGLGDVGGIGHTVKAILATLVQFRVLSGWASPAKPGTSTADVLTVRDVELAVNLALLLEEARLFRTYDPEAAAAIDAERGALPAIPDGFPPAEDRSLARLLATYAANGTFDAVDLYALFVGLDARGLSIAGVLAQSIAAMADQFVLKYLDYVGLTPFGDLLLDAALSTWDVVEGFLRGLFGMPSRQVEYVHQYLNATFVATGVGTRFFGPVPVSIPLRAYAVGSVEISVPAHALLVPFPTKDLLSAEYDGFWEDYFPRFNASVTLVGRSLRTLVSDFSTQLAESAVLADLLPDTATGPVDPADDASLLSELGDRVSRAVDDAIAWVREDPSAIETLMANLWEAIRATMRSLVEHLVASYDGLVDATTALAAGTNALAKEMYARASLDPEFAGLSDAEKSSLQAEIAADVDASGWVSAAYEGGKARDAERWRAAVDTANGESLRARLREAVVGAAGWLRLARESVHGIIREVRAVQDVASLRAVYRTRLGPIELWERDRPGHIRREGFRVRHAPTFLRESENAEGMLAVEIIDPATVPATSQTPNVHYTRLNESSHRPFTTTWSVRVVGALRLRLETVAAPFLGEAGLEPAVMETPWRLDFSFMIPSYSGWGLAGVSYRSSNSPLGDLWSFILDILDRAWSILAPVLRILMDIFLEAAKVMMQLLEPLMRFARDVVKFMADLTTLALDFLEDLARGVIDLVGALVDLLVEPAPEGSEFTIHAQGLRIDFLVNGDRGRDLEATARMGMMVVRLTVLDAEEAGEPRPDGTRWDVIATGHAVAHPFELHARYDPIPPPTQHAVTGQASWEPTWSMDFEGPVLQTVYAVGFSAPVSFPVGAATVDVEFGVRAFFEEDPISMAEEFLERAFYDLLDLMGEPTSWGSFGEFLAAYIQRFVESADPLFDAIAGVELYVSVDVKVGGAAGGGFTLSFAADGEAVRDLFEWLARNIVLFFRNGADPFAPAEYVALPPDILEHVWLRVRGYLILELPEVVQRAFPLLDGHVLVGASVQANVPVIGVWLGEEWGEWEVRFGAYVELGVGGVPVDFMAAEVLHELWLIRGMMRAY